MRVFYGYFRHYYLDGRRVPSRSTDGALTIFQPTIYTTSTPPGDVDYSLHKSNSTYLTDLDLARGYHFYCLFRVGLKKYSKKGPIFPALGGVTCTFKKEIRPFEKVEIWTRVLSWDSKWIYLISHFVKAAKARPARYTDQPWRKNAPGSAPAQTTLYATCISKYVVKLGRKTVPPDEFLAACGLLTPELEEEHSNRASSASGAAANGTTPACGRVSREEGSSDGSQVESVGRELEARRQKGLVLANHVAALDGGQDWFTGDGEVVFAKY